MPLGQVPYVLGASCLPFCYSTHHVTVQDGLYSSLPVVLPFAFPYPVTPLGCRRDPDLLKFWPFTYKILALKVCRPQLLLPSRFSRVRLCATPQMAAHQAPPSLGFSRQDHWSGLPFPSPTHESEKWKWSRSVVSDPQRPHGLQPRRLLRPWDFPGKTTGVGCHCLL